MTTKVPGSLLKDNSITQTQLATGSVGSDEIQSDAVTEAAYADASIPASAYKLLSVGTSVLANDSVTSDKIIDDAILAEHYGPASIPTSAYQLSSVTTSIIADAAVTTAKLLDYGITSTKIGDDAVIRAHIGPNAVGTTEIEDYKITPAKHEKGTKGDLLVATASDGSFTRLNIGSTDSVLTVKDGVPVWTNNVLPSGVIMDYCGSTAPTGWLMANGRTIGSSGSGATERANADTQTLYEFLWNQFDNTQLAVTGGRGASATADFQADKAIALPDFRGRTGVGRDAMGNNASNRITTATASADGDTMGATGGAQTHTLTEAQIPAHKHFTVADNGIDEDVDIGGSQANVTSTISTHRRGRGGDRNYVLYGDGTRPNLVPSKAPTNSVGSGSAHNNMGPFITVSKIIKL